ncbi:PREDICTED: cell wall / vacuolar inhibitor of fructosidase 1-like isoform X1 [Theobroma cacao]|uniref:Cell wall / vacuolar inhibitor of fructosidase 1-like isoform X1 n=2 Tax=Theobroma cacao TaxID=3641 RepID=A0AB32WR00_THECC|nr:PREDICTED: cell wall / vacuolar inhibitor of fructosidase 1-like isoform X1 [Theobroma cacao]
MKSLILFVFLLILPAEAFRPTLLLGNLIERTCRQTPFYDLCVWSLKTNPESRNADVKKLARIMVDSVLKNKASDTLDLIDELLQDGFTLDPALHKALSSCAERYSVIIGGDVPEIIEALETGDYKFAERGTNDAAMEANSCEVEFPGKSPLTHMNKVVHDVSVVAASIVKIILHSQW